MIGIDLIEMAVYIVSILSYSIVFFVIQKWAGFNSAVLIGIAVTIATIIIQ